MMFEEPSPATDFLVAATLRRCNDQGVPAYLVKRGDAERGTILLKLNRLNAGCEVWTEVRGTSGAPGWMQALAGKAVSDTQADEYVRRAVGRDPDLWVVEVEDPAGRNPFER